MKSASSVISVILPNTTSPMPNAGRSRWPSSRGLRSLRRWASCSCWFGVVLRTDGPACGVPSALTASGPPPFLRLRRRRFRFSPPGPGGPASPAPAASPSAAPSPVSPSPASASPPAASSLGSPATASCIVPADASVGGMLVLAGASVDGSAGGGTSRTTDVDGWCGSAEACSASVCVGAGAPFCVGSLEDMISSGASTPVNAEP
jgi:hypothetical protein